MTRASRPGPSGPELLALQHTATEEEVQQALLPFAAQWRTNPRHGTAVLSQLARQREAQRAWQVLKAMEQIHLELNVFHCSAVVSAFEKVSQWQAALGMLHSMAGRILPNSFTYNSAISACEKCAEWEHALSLLQLMVRQDLCDVISYNSSISACEKAARWVESLLLFQDAR
eukprot:g27850.t1